MAFRKATTNFLASKPEVLNVKWRETLGILELGPELNLCLPVDLAVGVGASLDVGFEAGGLLAYRYSRPKIVSRNALNKSGKKTGKFIFRTRLKKL